MIEEWRPVRNFEGVYEVSNFGNVKRIKGGTGSRVGRILAYYHHKAGHVAVFLREDGQRSLLLVNRLVWSAFNGAIPDSTAILHKDGNRQNNHLDNLKMVENYWETAAKEIGREQRLSAKLNAEQVAAVCAANQAGVSHEKLAKQYGIGRSTIGRVIRRERQAHVK